MLSVGGNGLKTIDTFLNLLCDILLCSFSRF